VVPASGRQRRQTPDGKVPGPGQGPSQPKPAAAAQLTLPNTTCLPFSQGVSAVVMKNCDVVEDTHGHPQCLHGAHKQC
jgi:hypothetical protein